MKKGLVTFLFLFVYTLASSQVDTEFWFAVPEVTDQHGDRPVYLRITSYDQEANVRINRPAAPYEFDEISVNVPQGEAVTVDLSGRLSLLEASVPSQVQNTGLHIVSDAPVTIYYEVSGTSSSLIVNTEIFTLKGTAALGHNFYTPFQNTRPNEHTQLTSAWSSFDIIATEDNTTITITPTKDLAGHPAGEPFTVVLDKGQVYSARSAGRRAEDHPTGSRVSSDKPVAITLKDDSVLEGVSYDLIGDQLLPVKKLSSDYVLVRSSTYASSPDQVVLTGVQNGTDVFINDNLAGTLDEGTSMTVPFDSLQTMVVRSTEPVYCFHIAGYEEELAGAIIPPLVCSGTRNTSFVRTTDEPFFINILAETGSENSFLLNGNPLNAQFSVVPNTNNQWSYANIEYQENTGLRSGTPHYLTNSTGDFYLSISNGMPSSTGFRFGYLSGYGEISLPPDIQQCAGTPVVISAGDNGDSYLWNTSETDPQIEVTESGTYSVLITKDTCSFRDTINVSFFPPVEDFLEDSISFCSSNPQEVIPEKEYPSYLWNTGQQTPELTPEETGTYSLTVTDQNNCQRTESIYAEVFSTPDASLTLKESAEYHCRDSSAVYVAMPEIEGTYRWNNLSGDTFRTGSNELSFIPDTMSVTLVTENGCRDSASIVVDCSPYIVELHNLVTPNGDNMNEVFIINNLVPDKWELSVFNRWGGRVYYNSAYDNSWKPEVTDGTYFYLLDHKSNERKIKGWLQIIR